MGCIVCTKAVEVDGDAVCSNCHKTKSLCLHCGKNKIYGKYATCRDCQLQKVGKCQKCDEPIDDESSTIYCVNHV